jgi:molecular chaperone DnaK (HSP70)
MAEETVAMDTSSSIHEVEMTDDTQSTDVVLGIDFGAQTCVASVAIKGQGLPVLVPNNLSNLSTP